MEALTASQRKDAEGVKDCFYALLGLGFSDEAEKGIQLVLELPGALKNDPVVTVGTAAYHIWNNDGKVILRIISKVGFNTLRRDKFVKFAAAQRTRDLLREGYFSTWVKKAQLLSLKGLCQEVFKQNPSMVPRGLTTPAKNVFSPMYPKVSTV